MNNDTNELINKADIPPLLKTYLLRNNNTSLYITENLLKDIEDIYIEYDSLYVFDESEFCSYIITSIKKQDKYDYFYYYLKKIFIENLKVRSKKELENYEELLQLKQTIKNIDESDIPKLLMELIFKIDEYKVSNQHKFLYLAYEVAGSLNTLFKLYPSNSYIRPFKIVYKRLEDVSKA